MKILRLGKVAVVATIAALASVVAFGNITDYGSNFAFVRGVMSMDTIFPDSRIAWRAVTSPAWHHAAYLLIILTELAVACFCWTGAVAMARCMGADADGFHQSKRIAIAGLTLGFLLWQFGFAVVAAEWFGMWMSEQWNGQESAFRFAMVILGALVFVGMRDGE